MGISQKLIVHICVFFALMILIFLFIFAFRRNHDSSHINIQLSEEHIISDYNMLHLEYQNYVEIHIDVERLTYDRNNLVYRMTNNTEQRYIYGKNFLLYARDLDIWRRVEFYIPEGQPGIAVVGLGFELSPYSSANLSIHLQTFFSSPLPDGEYRLIKEISHDNGSRLVVVGTFNL